MDRSRRNSTDPTTGTTDNSLAASDETDDTPADADRPLPDDLHWVLTDGRRRAVLAFLRERESATVADLADEVARTTDETAERLHVSLDRHHLPVMAEAGVVEYDRVSQQVLVADLSAADRDRIDRRLRASAESRDDDSEL